MRCIPKPMVEGCDMARHTTTDQEFVADGRKRLRETMYDEVRIEVEREFGEQLTSAGWFRRLFVRIEMRREIDRRLDRIAPPDALYLTPPLKT